MNLMIDPDTPRYHLSFEELPRGFVPWPQEAWDILHQLEEKSPFPRFADSYRTDTLTRLTLRYYYQGHEVAYRPSEGGIEVIAIGSEAVSYLKDRADPTIKVDQA